MLTESQQAALLDRIDAVLGPVPGTTPTGGERYAATMAQRWIDADRARGLPDDLDGAVAAAVGVARDVYPYLCTAVVRGMVR